LAEIRILSRDEKKQDDMRRAYGSPKLKFYLGDVRNEANLRDALTGVDLVFHAAALKQVPSCEFFPAEAMRTNSWGTENVLNASIAKGVRRVIVLSTDKALPDHRGNPGPGRADSVRPCPEQTVICRTCHAPSW
jgi:UDP-glucose 4-epimerase